MKDFLENFYSGLINFSPLKKYFKNRVGQFGVFPKIGFLTAEMQAELENILSIPINTPEYFEQALTHRSYLQVLNTTELYSNERLEFLGDSVLGMITAEYLFSIHTEVQEGDLTKMRARLVNKKVLAYVAKKLNLENFIQLSYGATRAIETGSDSILADAVEAVIAAIYIDSGLENARKFIIKVLMPIIMDKELFTDNNFKSILLELSQSKGYEYPKYQVIDEIGPDHEKEFTVEVYVDDIAVGLGKGKSKKLAEQSAAKDAIPRVKTMPDKIENSEIE